MCLGVDFYGFIHFRSAHLLESVGWCLLSHLGHFQPFYLSTFSAALSPLLLGLHEHERQILWSHESLGLPSIY